jgi:hypothetical protein
MAEKLFIPHLVRLHDREAELTRGVRSFLVELETEHFDTLLRREDCTSISCAPLAGRATGSRDLNVATITMAAMAALGVRWGSLPFARSTRSLCKQEVSANPSERARTPASFCHAEGRGFESLHPLQEVPGNQQIQSSGQ